MHLRRIEAYGFKSFADKIELDFNNGVTCIVGPNGCGKSNVSDAIRWVLGEQSAKVLRCKNMQEIIFNGTANRKALGYCEVSLFFDNTDKTYNIDCEELTITRKLYRSGDSEYYINKEKARLKDILDLFRDTGIGKDGYSVVGQGKIDAFLSAKPEDRRQIFEEAAGISKYKAKRLEATRKLEKTANNIEIIKGSLASYEQRIAPLEKQAKITLKARTLRERLKILEVNHYIYLTEHNSELKASLQSKLNDVEIKLKELSTSKQKCDWKYNAVGEELENLDSLYASLTSKRLELSVEYTKKEGKNRELSVELEALKKNIDRLDTEIKEKTFAIATHEKSKESSNNEHQQTIKEFCEAQNAEQELANLCEELSKAVERQKQEKEITNEMLYNSMGVWSNKNADLSRIEAEIRGLKAAKEESEDNIDKLKRELKEEDKKLAEKELSLSAYIADREEKYSLKKDINEAYEKKLSVLQESEDSKNELRDSITRLNSRMENLENNKNLYSNYDYAIRFLMNQKDERVKSKILGVLGSVISTSPQFATAIEVALGGSVGNIITKDQQDTSYLIDFLNINKGGRATFAPLSAMRPKPLEDRFLEALDEEGCYGVAADLVKYDRQFRPVIETFLGRVIVVSDKPTAVRMVEKYRNAFRIVTLDGAHYANNGTVTGGKREESDTRLLSMESDIAEGKKQLEKLKKSLAIISDDIVDLQKELKELENNSRALTDIIIGLDKRIGAEEQGKLFIVASKARIEGEIAKINQNLQKINDELTANNALYKITQSEVNSKSNEKLDSSEVLSELGRKLTEKEGQLAKATEKRTQALLRVKSLENKLSEIEKNIKFTAVSIDRLTKEINENDAVLCTERSRSEVIVKEIERIALESASSAELDEIKQKLEDMDGKKLTLKLNRDELFREIQATTDALQKVVDSKARYEANLENLDKEIVAVSEKMSEDYNLSTEEIMALREDGYEDNKGVAESKVLKKDIASLGDINEMAVEDLEEISAEYNKLKVHFDDVSAAKLELELTIADLTKKMEIIFAESFEKIKVNFSQVFTELFDGGRGYLDLDMEKGMSILDAGIKIEAEPPGKKLQNIDLLSGGERAMTAIAIIYAIIKLHPMPFCVLDEVDAPLDDSNADIFAKYLRKFSKNTQFIIVSHRKPTMELADQLYGITMQEKGVSKNLTVKLSEALKIAE